MDRRSFLKFIPGLVAAAAIAPEELLWTPTKTFFIPNTVRVATFEEINQIVTARIIPRLVDAVFKESPLLAYMTTKRKLIRVGPDGVKLSDFDLGGCIVEKEELDKAGWPLVQDPLGITQNLDERQGSHGSHKIERQSSYGQRGIEMDRQPAMYGATKRAMHRATPERSKGLVFPVSRFRSSYS